jgi:hypothetical protein
MRWPTSLRRLVNNKRDISDEVNAQVAKAGGDAIVKPSTKSSHCFLNYVTLVGVLPDCAKVSRRRGRSPRTSAAPPCRSGSTGSSARRRDPANPIPGFQRTTSK